MKTFRQKGLQFEITVSKILSNWLNRDIESDDLHFWRTQGSGAISTRVKNISTDFFSGDIAPLTEEGRKYLSNILIECKNTELDNNFLRNSFFPKQLEEYIDKLFSQMKEKSKNYGFLFLKRNRGKIWLLIVCEEEIHIDNLTFIKIYQSEKKFWIYTTDLNFIVENISFIEFFSNFKEDDKQEKEYEKED